MIDNRCNRIEKRQAVFARFSHDAFGKICRSQWPRGNYDGAVRWDNVNPFAYNFNIIVILKMLSYGF